MASWRRYAIDKPYRWAASASEMRSEEVFFMEYAWICPSFRSSVYIKTVLGIIPDSCGNCPNHN
jgi:hypothetical protein